MSRFLALSLAVALASPALATPTPRYAHLDPEAGWVVVTGVGFPVTSRLFMSLGDGSLFELDIVSQDTDSVVATIPAPMTLPVFPGNYVLYVGTSATNYGMLPITVDEVAPKVLQPVAVGTVWGDGTILGSTPNVASVTWDPVLLRYAVHFTDIHYYGPWFATNVTAMGGACPGGATARVDSVDDDLLVQFATPAGNGVPCAFQFTTWSYN